jgi:hypothetical protein
MALNPDSFGKIAGGNAAFRSLAAERISWKSERESKADVN